MTTRERRVEAADAGSIFHAVLIKQGTATAIDALNLWEDVQAVPSKSVESSGRWLARTLSMMARRRSPLRSLVLSYFRYTRALHTGYTLGDGKTTVNLNELRDDFFSQVEDIEPDLLNADRELVDDDGVIVTRMPPSRGQAIKTEKPSEDLEQALDELDADEEEEAHDALINVGPVTLENKINKIDDSLPAKEVDALREEAHREAGARTAAVASRSVINGGRKGLERVAINDERVIGWVRVSGTGTPCGWCGMLISRGIVYKSASSAGGQRGEERKFHPNCNCYAEPVYSQEQYDEDERFDLNRELDALWPKVTRGKSAKAALKAWRKFMRTYQPQSTQAADFTSQTQEA